MNLFRARQVAHLKPLGYFGCTSAPIRLSVRAGTINGPSTRGCRQDVELQVGVAIGNAQIVAALIRQSDSWNWRLVGLESARVQFGTKLGNSRDQEHTCDKYKKQAA